MKLLSKEKFNPIDINRIFSTKLACGILFQLSVGNICTVAYIKQEWLNIW